MRYPKDHKKVSRQKIVRAAVKAFNRCGMDGIGVADIMEEAGLTQGAFSGYFSSKEQLIREALDESFDQTLFERGEFKDRPLEEIMKAYLNSPIHDTCPCTTLMAEVARRPAATRNKFHAHLEILLSEFESRMPAKMSPSERKETAIVVFGLLVGAVQLSRATKGTKLSETVIDAALKGAMNLIHQHDAGPSK